MEATLTAITGSAFTVTVEVADDVHVALVPTTVYTVVVAGLAFTELPVVLLSPLETVQE